MDHDRLFKELLTAFFAEFIALFLPDAFVYLDASTLKFLDKELFTDATAGDNMKSICSSKLASRHKTPSSSFMSKTSPPHRRTFHAVCSPILPASTKSTICPFIPWRSSLSTLPCVPSQTAIG